MNNLGNIAASILNAATSGGGDAERKADFDAVANAVQGIKIPDLQQLAALKTQVQGLFKEGGVPLSVQGAASLLLQNLNELDANSQESGNQVWETLKPLLGNSDKLSLLVKAFGEYGGKLLGILKAVFLRT